MEVMDIEKPEIETTGVVMNCVMDDKDKLPEHLTAYLREIYRCQIALEQTEEENYARRIYIMSQALVYLGQVASYTKAEAKRAYNRRKLEFAKAKKEATKNKADTAEIAVEKFREEEAEWSRMSDDWNNLLDTMTHEMQALKHQLKVQLNDGSAQAY